MRPPKFDLSATEPAKTRELVNRDVSDLAFVQRVLEQAENEENPLLERARYLAITGMLLDEFYRIRVAALREQIRQGSKRRSDDGRKPSAQLKQADKLSNRLVRRQDRCWRALHAELRQAGVHILAAREIHDSELEILRDTFDTEIKPFLRPQPSNSDALLESIRDGELLMLAELPATSDSSEASEVFVHVPASLPRLFRLPGKSYRFAPIEAVIKLFFDELLEGRTAESIALARVLREGSLKRFDGDDDLVSLVKDAIERREHADVIRLRVERSMSASMTYSLSQKLRLLDTQQIKALEKSRRKATRSEFVVSNAFLGMSDLMQLVEQLPPEFAAPLSYPDVRHKQPAFINEFNGDLFQAIAAEDRLLHFPYDDFDVLVELIRQAAADDAVVGLRQTLYRTDHESPIIHALLDAARNGKSVSVIVEVEAREDEERNIQFAALLEQAGADVSYGLLDRKVHAKLLIIERIENGATRRYVHCSTGNYSVSSGRHYTDLCLLSANEHLAEDTHRLFDYARAGHELEDLHLISIAPLGLRERIEALIRREIDHAIDGKPAAIWMKVNKLSDPKIIRLLYAASQAGVEIDIVVRGINCLRAGVPGLSECIRVKSVVGRYLEHSRAFCFGSGRNLPDDSAEVFISSADLMPHKLDQRVEILVPIENAALRRQIQDAVFRPYFEDQANSWTLTADDEWIRTSPSGYDVHAALFE